MRYIVIVVAVLALVLGCTSKEDMFGNGHRNTSAGIPPKHDCQEHLNRCLDTPLQSKPGGSAGQSRCVDCYDICRNNLRWPDREHRGKDCPWWKY